MYAANFQGACEEYFSWSFTQLGTVDIAKEEVVSSHYFDGNRHVECSLSCQNKSIGKKIPGLHELCKKLVKCHTMMQTKYPHLGTIGWDAMRLDNGEYVVFEGNTGF